jgi:hypothetical protein
MVHPRTVPAMTMGVDRVGPRTGPAAPDGAATPRDDNAFAAFLPPPDTPHAAPAGAPPPAATLSGLACLEAGIADALARQARDKQARRHGRAMLQALGAVQLALLAGDDGQARAALAALAATAIAGHEADDPVLQLILREIAVRAAVELARDDPAREQAAEGHLATDVSNA